MRATVKIWFVVFCCCTTGATHINVMENYSTEAFLLGTCSGNTGRFVPLYGCVNFVSFKCVLCCNLTVNIYTGPSETY